MRKAKSKKKPSLAQRISALEKTLRVLADAQKLPSASPNREAPLLTQMLKDAELRASKAELSYAELARKLVGLLTPDQKEAARIAGCSEALYAIEWIELQKPRLFPNQSSLEQPFLALRQYNPNQEPILR